jgi:tripeptide aminopeptidase
MPDRPPEKPSWEIDSERALDLVLRLMAIPGRSGEEREAADFVRQTLVSAGIDPSWIVEDDAFRRTPLAGNSGNLILKLPGTVAGPRRMFSAHLDTVPLCVGSQPVLRDGRVESADPHTALGADDRAGVAALVNAVLEIVERRLPHPPLTFLWPVQEEIGLHGARCVDQSLLGEPALAFNWDGGSPVKVTLGATGGWRGEIRVTGIASHAGGAPEWGVSAIAIAALAVADLHREGWHGLVEKDGHRGTSNVGVIHGGDATNVVTDQVTLRVEARSHDAAFRQQIVDRIARAFEDAAREVHNVAGATGGVTITGRVDYESFRLSDEEPCVVEAERAIRAQGRTPDRVISNGGLDANWLTAHGIPTVTLGCGQLRQHMTSEALDVEDYLLACRLVLDLATASSRGH